MVMVRIINIPKWVLTELQTFEKSTAKEIRSSYQTQGKGNTLKCHSCKDYFATEPALEFLAKYHGFNSKVLTGVPPHKQGVCPFNTKIKYDQHDAHVRLALQRILDDAGVNKSL